MKARCYLGGQCRLETRIRTTRPLFAPLDVQSTPRMIIRQSQQRSTDGSADRSVLSYSSLPAILCANPANPVYQPPSTSLPCQQPQLGSSTETTARSNEVCTGAASSEASLLAPKQINCKKIVSMLIQYNATARIVA